MILPIEFIYLVQSFGKVLYLIDPLVIYVILDPVLWKINVHVPELFYLMSRKLVSRVGRVYGGYRISSAFC